MGEFFVLAFGGEGALADDDVLETEGVGQGDVDEEGAFFDGDDDHAVVGRART